MSESICARCGEKIRDADAFGIISWNLQERSGKSLESNPFSSCVFCESCMIRAKLFLKKRVIKDEQELGEEKGKKKSINHAKIRELKESGLGYKEIAKELGMKPTAVSHSLSRYKDYTMGELKGIKQRRKVDHGKIRALKNAGWSVKEIAEEMGMNPGSVSVSLHDHPNIIEEQEEEYWGKKF